MHKVIFKSTFYQTLTRIVTSGVGFLITIFIARYFGVLGFGEFTKITAFVGLFYLFADFGLNAVFLREEENYKFNDLFYLRLLIATILILIINFFALILPYNSLLNFGFSPHERVGILIYSFTIFSQSVMFSSSAIFQKKFRYDLLALSSAAGSILSLLLIVFFSIYRFSIDYIYISLLMGAFLAALISVISIKDSFLENKLSFSFMKSLIKESAPIGLMLIFNLVYFRIDTILLSIFRSTVEVGIYGFSYKFFDFLVALPLFLSNSIYPILLKNLNEKARFKNSVKKYIGIYTIISFIVIIIFWFSSPLFTLVRQDFASAIIPFRILLFSLPFFFVTSILQWALIAQKKQNYLMFVYIFSAILNVLLNIIFIPSFGYIASAIITGATEAVVFILLLKKFIKN